MERTALVSCTIVVDLDGTLTPTDTLVESLIKLFRTSPFQFLCSWAFLSFGIAAFKQKVSELVALDVEKIPYRADLLAFLEIEKRRGKRLVLATAADRQIASAVAAHLNLFDDILSSDGRVNLKGSKKLQAIQELVGGNFIYAGDSRADLEIWKAADAGILVGNKAGVAEKAGDLTRVSGNFASSRPGLATWLRAFRVSHWLKNGLMFIPAIAGMTSANAGAIYNLINGFVAFGMLTSATYIFNDLWDLESDRRHPTKCRRPLAAGDVSIVSSIVIGITMFLISLGIGYQLNFRFFLGLLLYVIVTTAYSLAIKNLVIIDVLVLAILLNFRVVLGGLLCNIAISSWLLAFSYTAFFSLAILKRCTELIKLKARKLTWTDGRGYSVKDLKFLWPAGISTTICSIVIFLEYVSNQEIIINYQSPALLWVAGIGITYWMSRLWIITARGEMDDDPIAFAIKDKTSLITVAIIAFVFLVSRTVPTPLFFSQ
ncbi:MAG: 4-hydroxybenzoate polyprenyltransferase [Rhodopirellula sp.]|nr:4-hydroxybenzoate polyprenyltransferase [Rhodopirellula sp.]